MVEPPSGDARQTGTVTATHRYVRTRYQLCRDFQTQREEHDMTLFIAMVMHVHKNTHTVHVHRTNTI